MNPDREGAGVSRISAGLCTAKLWIRQKKMLCVTELEQAEFHHDRDHQLFVGDTANYAAMAFDRNKSKK